MEKGKEATGTEEQTKDCSCADGNVPAEVSNKVEGEEELHPYMTMAWDPPRRLINY